MDFWYSIPSSSYSYLILTSTQRVNLLTQYSLIILLSCLATNTYLRYNFLTTFFLCFVCSWNAQTLKLALTLSLLCCVFYLSTWQERNGQILSMTQMTFMCSKLLYMLYIFFTFFQVLLVSIFFFLVLFGWPAYRVGSEQRFVWRDSFFSFMTKLGLASH